jgi:hypothetical protein
MRNRSPARRCSPFGGRLRVTHLGCVVRRRRLLLSCASRRGVFLRHAGRLLLLAKVVHALRLRWLLRSVLLLQPLLLQALLRGLLSGPHLCRVLCVRGRGSLLTGALLGRLLGGILLRRVLVCQRLLTRALLSCLLGGVLLPRILLLQGLLARTLLCRLLRCI